MGNDWSLGGPTDGHLASGQVERTRRQRELGKSGTENLISFHFDQFLPSYGKERFRGQEQG